MASVFVDVSREGIGMKAKAIDGKDIAESWLVAQVWNNRRVRLAARLEVLAMRAEAEGKAGTVTWAVQVRAAVWASSVGGMVRGMDAWERAIAEVEATVRPVS